MAVHDYDNDELVFLDEGSTPKQPAAGAVWHVLVVDDDEEIHSVTRLALSGLEVNNRSLKFHHAYSGEEALTFLREFGQDVAVILLDVVMETDDAGLQVAKKLREELKLIAPRIILRTGQPGYAPEEQVIKDYDINDYKTKTELTRIKLVTAMIAAIRSFQQIQVINQSRRGLEKIIHSAANLLEKHSVKGFCEGVVGQLCGLLGLDGEGIVCARAGSVIDKDDDGVYVLGAAGHYAAYINEQLESITDERIIYYVNESLKRQEHIFEDDFSVLYINSSGYEAAVFIDSEGKIDEVDQQLIEVFLHSVGIGYENVNLFQELRNAAFRDWLTRLPNRNEFINRIGKYKKQRPEKPAAVALVDINHFSDINDGLGQEAGNELLIAVANRLLQHYPEERFELGRVAADVFGVIGPEEHVNPDEINGLFSNPFKLGDHLIPVNVCIGLKRVDLSVDSTGINMLKHINIALNRAKKNQATNYEYYSPDIEEQTTWRLGMIRQLRSDFEDRKLEIWYQPQVDLVTEKVVGMEALLRWPSGDGGFISPVVFIPLAEYSGLIIEIGAWVLDEACATLKKLGEKGFTGLRMAVNISVPQFRDPGFVSLVKDAVSAHKLNPRELELEITESVVMDEPHIVVEALLELKKFGVQIAIDDFGTGFSSLSYLKQLPLDRLKVDRSFVMEVAPGKPAVIAETVVTLGNKLGLYTIAEGVERREQASYLLKLGCDEAQGYLYAKPMPYKDLLEFLS